ncbi:MAG: hypothetical protein ACKO8V_09360, partial [Actinomycetota bacterium]
MCFKGRLEFRCRIGRDARWSKGANQHIILGEFANEISENDVLVGTFRPTSVAAYAAAELKAAFEAQLLR